MPVHPPSVSVVDPISPALSRVKTILFAPFDIRKWFIIGFGAWLSSCGEQGGSGPGNAGSGGGDGGSGGRDDIRRGFEAVWEYIVDNLVWIIPAVIALILFCLAIWLVVVWLNSRGKFMFLHCVALNRAEIRVPWENYASHAHSLFLFRVLLGLLSFAVMFPLIAGSVAVVFFALMGEGSLVGPIALAVMGILFAVLVGLAFGVVKKLLYDFIVPIMFKRTDSVREAWREFIPLIKENLLRYIGYILFSVVITIILGTVVALVGIVTCCTAFCLFAIPYIGAVALLPIHVFQRAYSLYYFQQYGPDYTLIEPDEVAPLPAPESAAPQ